MPRNGCQFYDIWWLNYLFWWISTWGSLRIYRAPYRCSLIVDICHSTLLNENEQSRKDIHIAVPLPHINFPLKCAWETAQPKPSYIWIYMCARFVSALKEACNLRTPTLFKAASQCTQREWCTILCVCVFFFVIYFSAENKNENEQANLMIFSKFRFSFFSLLSLVRIVFVCKIKPNCAINVMISA